MSYDKLRDLVSSKAQGLDEQMSKWVRFELNHLELHHLDDYLLNLYNRGVSDLPNKNNSSIAYLIGITNEKPTARINTVGGGFPDIDTDFSQSGREKIFEYLKNKYGNGFAHIGTMTWTAGKSVWAASARIHGIPFAKANKVSSMMPDLNCPRLESLLKEDKAIAKLYKEDQEIKEAWDDAVLLQDCVSNIGLHACYTSGCFVTTIDGIKDISEIEVGDLVLTHAGEYKPVVRTSRRVSDDIYRIKTSETGEFFVTGSHPIGYKEVFSSRPYDRTLKKYSRLKKVSELKFKQVSDLNPDVDYLVFGNNQTSFLPDEEKSKEYNIDFSNKDFWWICGLFVADGWTEDVKRVAANGGTRYDKRAFLCCEKNDDEVLEISKRLNSCGLKFKVSESRTCYKFYIHVSGTRIFEYFKTFGVGAHNKCPNYDVLHLPKEYLVLFLNGYFYGDGYITNDGDSVCFSTVSKRNAYTMSSLINKAYGVRARIGHIKPGRSIIDGRTINCSEQFRVRFSKTSRITKLSEVDPRGNVLCRIREIEKLDIRDTVYNLTVLDDSTYVVNNHITHNCGVVLSDNPIYETVPMWDSKGAPVTQYEGSDIERFGLVKLDILGLKCLDLIGTCVDMIEQRTGRKIEVYQLPMDDDAAYKIMWEGQNLGIFQFEGAGISNFVNRCKPKTIHDIAMITAGFRPGPLSIPGFMDQMAARIRGDEDDGDFLFPKYTHIFKSAHNLLIYQEQFMQLAMDMCGFTEIEADKLRKATGDLIPNCPPHR